MTTWAILREGVATDVTTEDPSGRFHPSIVWTVVPDGTERNARLVNGEWLPPPAAAPPAAPPPPDMAAERQAAFNRAMEAGKRIEAAILNRYTAGEPLTWPTQEREARIVKDGGTLPAGSLLLVLAARRGVTPLAMADLILEKAAFFIAVVAAGQELRRAAEGLLSPTLDTPEALATAVEALRQIAVQQATALGLPPPQ